MARGIRLLAIASLAGLTACSQIATAAQPDVEFQDVSLSLSTVNPEEHLQLFEYDRSQPLDVEVVKSWRRLNVTVTELTFESPRGERVPTLLFEPDGEGPFAGLVLMHGAPGTKENFSDLGVYYAQYGFVAVAITAPQFRSDHNIGHVSMALIWPRFDEYDVEEQSQLMLDLQRAVDLLLSRGTVDPERLGYIGGSYGGAVGGLFAGVETRLKAYVLKVGDGGIIEHLSEPDEQGYPKHLDLWVDVLWPIEPLHFVGRAAPAELLFQNGISDSYVPASDTLRYFQAASDPKTILWYNSGHFLPVRHYYDHLMWQHERIGVDTLLLKPFFGANGILYDRLLILWVMITLASMAAEVWLLVGRDRAGWGAALSWLLATLFLGVAALLVYLFLWRSRRSEDVANAARALSATVWIVPLLMIGIVAIRQISFLTDLEWWVIGWFFFLLPQLPAVVALLIRELRSKAEDASKPGLATSTLSTLFLSTLILTPTFLVFALIGREIVHFSFPVYLPLAWVVIMLASILLVLIAWPLVFGLRQWGLPMLEMPGALPPIRPDERPAFRWYKPLALWIGSMLLLFFVQAAYASTLAPSYVRFVNILKTMLSFGSAN